MGLFGRRKRETPEEAFLAEVAAILRATPGVTRVEPRPDFALDVHRGDGEPGVIFLQNIWFDSRQREGADRTAWLTEVVRSLATVADRPETWEDARGRLMPAVRAASFLSEVSGSERKALIARPLAPHLVLTVAIDDEHTMSFVSGDDLDRWQVDPDELFEEARVNLLRQRCPGEHLDGPALSIVGPDGYVSSWIASPGHVAADLSIEEDDLVLVAPTRDDLIVTTKDDPTLEAILAWALESHRESPRSLSPVAYVKHGSGIAPWSVAPDHPLALSLQRAGALLFATEYDRQKASLDERDEQEGIDRWVASTLLAELPDGTYRTRAVWAEAVTDGLLPPVDDIAFVDESGDDVFLVGWDVVLELAADALERVDGLDPPRWRFTGWPSDEAVAALRARGERPEPR